MAEEYRASAMRPLPELEVIRVVVVFIAVDVMHRLARQQLATVDVLPDIQVHRPAVATEVHVPAWKGNEMDTEGPCCVNWATMEDLCEHDSCWHIMAYNENPPSYADWRNRY